MNKKALIRNMIANIMCFVLNTVISFALTTYIINGIDGDVYQFVSMANSFTNYVTIITVALNSMAVRYIMISMERKPEDAKKFYNSVIVANMILAAILVLPSALVVAFCDSFLKISPAFVVDVKINFALIFLNFIANLVFSTTGQVYYLTNKLYLNSLRTMESTIIRAVVMFLLFWLCGDHIYFVAIASIVATVYLTIFNIYYRRKLLPEFRFDPKQYEWKKIKTLISSGIWNSVTKLSQVLTAEMDVLLTNMFIDKENAEVMAASKTLPNVVAAFQVSVASIFTPNLTEIYAKEDKEGLKNAVKSAMRIMTVFTSIPNAMLVALGMGLYSLWLPDIPTKTIYILAVITATNSVVTGILQPIYSIFTITNKVKQNSIAMTIYGVWSVVTTLLMLKYTSLGIYAIAGVSQIGSIVLAFIFHLPQGSKALELKKTTFLPEVFISVVSFLILSAVGYGITLLVPANNWGNLFLCAVFTGLVGLFINGYLVLNKEQRTMIIGKVLRKS